MIVFIVSMVAFAHYVRHGCMLLGGKIFSEHSLHIFLFRGPSISVPHSIQNLFMVVPLSFGSLGIGLLYRSSHFRATLWCIRSCRICTFALSGISFRAF